MNELSIKRKLLIYGFLIHTFILILFSASLHKAIEISTLDKMKTSLKVILLDVVDDIKKYNYIKTSRTFDEEDEYNFKPLYIRLVELHHQTKSLKVIKTTPFPKSIATDYSIFNNHPLNKLHFEKKEHYIINTMKTKIDGNEYIIQVATDDHILNDALENLLYTLIFILPIILVLATLGGYFIIYKSFSPIEKIIKDLKEINAKSLSKRLERLHNEDEIDNLSKEINSLLTRLEFSFEKISQFSSDASHELKTPLTIIRGEIEVALRKKRTKEEYEETLTSCLHELLLIQQTIDDLLFLAKTEEKLIITEKDIEMNTICLESIEELSNLAKLKSITMVSSINSKVFAQINPKLLKVAIKNILKNAINFSHHNGKVELLLKSDNNTISIHIKDYGIGIPKNEQEKIFEKFYRTDKSRNKNSGGTGLGMAICQKIISMHQGEIIIHSEENKGTEVIIKLNKINNLY